MKKYDKILPHPNRTITIPRNVIIPSLQINDKQIPAIFAFLSYQRPKLTIDLFVIWNSVYYRKTSTISRTLVGNKIVDNSDVVGASPVGAAPTTSSFST